LTVITFADCLLAVGAGRINRRKQTIRTTWPPRVRGGQRARKPAQIRSKPGDGLQLQTAVRAP